MKVIVQFSGGKDSTACLLWVRNNITTDFLTVFCDTGFESEITYKYINQVSKKLKLNLITIKSKKYADFIDLAVNKKRFPSTKARFCTEELKSKPMIDFVLDEINDDVLIIQGIRKDESFSRSKMAKQCTFFKYYFAPYKIDPKTKKPKFHSYRKKQIVKFKSQFSDDILRPVFDWSGQQVIDYIIANGLKPNPLYSLGMKRVGCFPCIMANHQDIKSMVKYIPERITEISEYEQALNTSFFPPDKIPKRFTTNGKYPTMIDVKNYLNNKNATLDMFKTDHNQSCMSFYGLCE